MNLITRTVKPTKAQALAVLKLVRDKYGISPTSEYGPELRMDFDWFGHGGWPTIVWEGGPYDWAVDCSFEVLEDCPRGVWLEPATGWALGIYRDITR